MVINMLTTTWGGFPGLMKLRWALPLDAMHVGFLAGCFYLFILSPPPLLRYHLSISVAILLLGSSIPPKPITAFPPLALLPERGLATE